MVYQGTLTICHGGAFPHLSFILTRTTFLCCTVLIFPTLQGTFTIFLVFNNKLWLDCGGVDALIVEKSFDLVGNTHVLIWRSAGNVRRG